MSCHLSGSRVSQHGPRPLPKLSATFELEKWMTITCEAIACSIAFSNQLAGRRQALVPWSLWLTPQAGLSAVQGVRMLRDA